MAEIMADRTSIKTLRDGRKIPVLGMGMYMVGEEAASWALETGYRLLDTATLYQ